MINKYEVLANVLKKQYGISTDESNVLANGVDFENLKLANMEQIEEIARGLIKTPSKLPVQE